jgi:hypothetical protein
LPRPRPGTAPPSEVSLTVLQRVRQECGKSAARNLGMK